jgi:hypothetical protein
MASGCQSAHTDGAGGHSRVHRALDGPELNTGVSTELPDWLFGTITYSSIEELERRCGEITHVTPAWS